MSYRSQALNTIAFIVLACMASRGLPAQDIPVPDVSAQHTCDNLPHSDHPVATISNGRVRAVIFLPDQDRGYYRGPRFDWGGVVGCVSLDGHTFFGEWFNRYDPLDNDAVTGPVEEFRHPVSELGYEEAAPGGLFVKIGVGVLRRVDRSPYRFGGAYPIVDHGVWTVKVTKRSVTFRQELRSPVGFAYVYEKVLRLTKDGTVLALEHRLKNIGKLPIDTAVYNHDFYMLDNKPTGPGMEIRLPFTPIAESPLPASVQMKANSIRFVEPIQPQHTIGSYLTGYSDKASDYDITFQDENLRMGVEQSGDAPLAKMYLWATSKTVCPEAYIAIHVNPGATQKWSIRLRLFTW